MIEDVRWTYKWLTRVVKVPLGWGSVVYRIPRGIRWWYEWSVCTVKVPSDRDSVI